MQIVVVISMMHNSKCAVTCPPSMWTAARLVLKQVWVPPWAPLWVPLWVPAVMHGLHLGYMHPGLDSVSQVLLPCE